MLFLKSIYKYFLLALLIAFLVLSYKIFNVDLILDLFNQSQININNAGIYSLLFIFFLRSISIIIPIIPGTYCAVIAGYLYGIKSGMLIMLLADFISCSSSFFISRRLGRDFVKRLLGKNQMKRIEGISKRYLEDNLFLMTGFLMTSWFDFVCYAVGLTRLSWKKFMPALFLSILISDLPFVAGGYTLSGLKGVNISQILNGEVKVLQGPYLLVLIISALIIFGMGLFNSFVRKNISSVDY